MLVPQTVPDHLCSDRTNPDQWATLAERAFTARSTRRLVWDAETQKAGTTSLTMSPAEAMRQGIPHTALPRAGWVAIDADAELGPEARTALATAASHLGITLGGSPSGSATEGVEHLTLLARPGSSAHVLAFCAIVKHLTDGAGGVRRGQGTRPPGSAGYKPHHDPMRSSQAVVLGADGTAHDATVEDLIAAISVPSPVGHDALPALLAGLGIDPDATTTTISPSQRAGTPPRALFEALPHDLRAVAMTNGAGHGANPQSRSEGQFLVVRSLIRRGYADGDIAAFLSAFPIGERRCRPAQVRQSLEAWGDTVVEEPHRAAADRFWNRHHGSAPQIVAAAAVAHVIARAGHRFHLSVRECVELTGLSTKALRAALGAIMGLAVVEEGDRVTPTRWAYDPHRGGRPHSGKFRPHWAQIVEIARSDAAQGGGLAAGEILALAAVRAGATTAGDIAAAYGLPVRSAQSWVRGLRRAGVLADYDFDQPRAPLTIVSTLDRAYAALDGAANATRDRHAQERAANAADIAASTERWRAFLEGFHGDPGVAAAVVEADLVIPEGTEALWDAAWCELEALPGPDAGWDDHRDALADHVTAAALEAAQGDLDLAGELAAGVANGVAAWAGAGKDQPRGWGTLLAVVAQLIDALAAGVARDDMLAAAVRAGAEREVRIPIGAGEGVLLAA